MRTHDAGKAVKKQMPLYVAGEHVRWHSSRGPAAASEKNPRLTEGGGLRSSWEGRGKARPEADG